MQTGLTRWQDGNERLLLLPFQPRFGISLINPLKSPKQIDLITPEG